MSAERAPAPFPDGRDGMAHLLRGVLVAAGLLVDHALSRAERGLVGILHVEGQPNPEIFDGKIEPGSGH